MAIEIRQAGDAGDNLLSGTIDDDILSGLGGNDTLHGLDGNDILDGGTGIDLMYGGTGDDTYYVDDSSDMPIENVDEGRDTVRASISFTLPANVENLVLTGTAYSGTGNALANVIQGTSGDNQLTGNDGNDRLYGRAGGDALWGGNGNDMLDGGTGVDGLFGGMGDDTYVVDEINDVAFELAGQGFDTVRSTAASYALSASIERLILVRGDIDGYGNDEANQIIGSNGDNELRGHGGDDVLQGRGGDDVLLGGAGNDRLDGGSGTNRLEGGAGDDIYYVASDNLDTVIEAADSGYDTVRSTAYSYLLTDNVEALVLMGAAVAGTGNALDNAIEGNGYDNMLDGGGGNDRISGKDGADTIMGQDGNDTLLGGDGDDTLVGGDGNDVLTGGEGDDELFGGAGIDILRGGDGDDYLYFSTADSIGDTHDGGAGMDTLVVGLADASGTTFDLTSGRFLSIDNLTITGEGNTVLLGGSLVSRADFDQDLANGDLTVLVSPDTVNTTIDASAVRAGHGQISVIAMGTGAIDLIGTANDDRATLGGGNDVAGGGAGNDILGGYDGNDTLFGGSGDDILWGGSGADLFSFAPLETGHDMIMDFAAGDLIDMESYRAFTSINNFQSITEVDGNTVITINAETTITLMAFTGLTGTDFLFSVAP